MDVPITERRKQISILFGQKKYAELEKFGIRMVEGASGLDCGNYVLHKLGAHASPQSITVIWSAPRSPRPHDGIILYRFRNKPTIQQHGFMKGDKVISKWGKDEPVFEHNIEDVPADYGDVAEFVVIDDTLKFRLQEMMHPYGGAGY